MRLPDDYDDHSGLSPSVMTAIFGVTIFIAAILVIVLMVNKKPGGGQRPDTGLPVVVTEGPVREEGTDYVPGAGLVSGSTLSPDDLDFWEQYPEKTEEPPEKPQATGTVTAEPPQPTDAAEHDPSTDGKHTLVINDDGQEEWVLISPYLPKNDYDYTKLVCQSDRMKYYVDGKQVSYVGVDLSERHDYVDYGKLRKAGIDFVMIRLGARGYGSGQLGLDAYFADNMKRASDAGLEIGVYFTSQAIDEDEVVDEAIMVIENLGDYEITYPVAFAMGHAENDTARVDRLSKAEKTELAKTFLDILEEEGYKTILYGEKEWLIKELDLSKLTNYDFWLSQPGDLPDYPYRFAMWQYKTDAFVDGVVGPVALNISFINYKEK